MILKEIKKLRKGDFINHKWYGLCIVDSFNQLGIIIRPLTIEGFNLLMRQSGTCFNRFLEDSKRLILSKVENPEIPKLIIKKGKKYKVHEWEKLGVVSPKGIFSTRVIKTFTTLQDAVAFTTNPPA